MRCLYCGREIGAFKLRRAGEFCSKDHRKNYGDRLNKALHQIAEPEPPPAGVAGFAASWPAQNGCVLPSLHCWDPGKGYRVFLPGLALDAVNAADSKPADFLEPVPEPEQEAYPPLYLRAMPGLQAEPAASFVQAGTAHPALFDRSALRASTRLPSFSMAAELAVRVPPARSQWVPGRLTEPVTSFVAPTQAAYIPCLAKPRVLSMAASTATQLTPPRCECMPAAVFLFTPGAEPAARMALPVIAAVLAGAPAPVQLRVLDLAPELEALVAAEEPVAVPALCESPCEVSMPGLAAAPAALMVWPAAGEPFFTDISLLLRGGVPYQLPSLPMAHRPAASTAAMPVRNAEPVATLVCLTAAQHVTPSSHEAVPEIPAFALSPVLAPTLDNATFVEPPLCQDWMRALEPEPAFAFVRSAAAGQAFRGIVPRAAALTLAIDPPCIQSTATWQPLPAAEPVMAGVWPRACYTPMNLASAPGELRLPGLVALSPFAEPNVATARPEVAAPADCASPDPVESWLRAAAETGTTMAAQAACLLPEPEPAALMAFGPLPAMAGPVAGALPVGAESLLVSTAVAARALYDPAVLMQPFALAAGTPKTAPGFDKPSLAPTPSAPKRPEHILVLGPICTISVTPPKQQSSAPRPTVPQCEFIPVEYHAQRMRGEPVCRPKWQTPRLRPTPPRFAVRPLFDRLEEVAPAQRTTRKQPAFADVFTMPEAKKHANRPLAFVAKAIAAGLVIGAVWLGTGVVRLSRPSLASRQDVFSGGNSSAGPSLSAAAREAVPGQGQAAATGPVAWMQRAIVNRASSQAGDNFREGMQAWGSAPKTYASGWQRNAEGYVRPGDLALFGPSLKLADYRFEFFGQVDQKSMGWVVRAKDQQNYYAMKVKVLKAGLRPIIAVVHYPVVGGKAGHSVETPLNVMVHNNRPFQVAINVKGSHFSASIEGEEVDSWSDAALPSGGVGFFAEAGASARLYWMKVTRNDDWLGRVCEMLAGSGSGAQVTSELWGPGVVWGPIRGAPQPGTNPRPGTPEPNGTVTMAAAGLGLPGLKARGARDLKYGRYQPWSS